jgi:uncharacterized damage-inducible protein DinB
MGVFFVTQSILKLCDYHLWANDKMISHLATLPEAVLYTEVENVFPNILQTLGHMYSVDQTWLSRIRGEHIEQIMPKQFDSIEMVQRSYSCLGEEMKSVVSLHVNHADKLIQYQNTKGEVFRNTISEIVQHMVNHGTYHRGNIASMIRQLGYTGVATDYIIYLRQRE